jgi:MFS transporter, ACS family, glucarate transporter
VVWMASRIGGAISPLLVVPIQAAYGWRAAFFIFGAAGVVWCAAWFLWYRDTPAQMKGVSAQEIEEIGVFTRQSHSVPWKLFTSQRNFWVILAMYHTYCWGSYFYLSWLHTFLIKGRGLSEGEMRVLSPWPFVAGACGNLIGGALSDVLCKRYGRRWGRAIVGGTGLAVSALMMMLCASTGGKTSAIVYLSFGYFAMDSMLPVAWAVCLDVAKNYGGAMSGAMNMAGQFGSFLSSLAFGYVVEYSGSYDAPLFVFSIMLGISAFLFTRIRADQPLVKDEDPGLAKAA